MKINFILIACIILPMAIAGGLNGYLLGMKTNKKQTAPRSKRFPSGWLVGTIWTLLFGVMGYIFYLYRKDPIITISIVTLFVSCLIYPFYTSKFSSLKASKIGNTTSLIFAHVVTTILAARATNNLHILLMTPMLIWTSFVNYTDALL